MAGPGALRPRGGSVGPWSTRRRRRCGVANRGTLGIHTSAASCVSGALTVSIFLKQPVYESVVVAETGVLGFESVANWVGDLNCTMRMSSGSRVFGRLVSV